MGAAGSHVHKAPQQAGTSKSAAPAGLVAERFEMEGVEFVAFSWDLSADTSRLTPAERAVLELLVQGASTAKIASARRKATRTVSNQVASILRKLGAGSRYELMARFGSAARR